MGEKNVLNVQILNYSGLFDLKRFLKTVDSIFTQRGYGRKEAFDQELVREGGKDITLSWEYGRNLNPTMKGKTNLMITMRKVRDVDVDVDKRKERLQQGDISVKFITIIETDPLDTWHNKMFYYFLEKVLMKYVFRSEQEKFEEELIGDASHAKAEIGAYLNLHRYKKY